MFIVKNNEKSIMLIVKELHTGLIVSSECNLTR